MTEEQIERHVERMFDVLDGKLMRSEITQEEYDKRSREIAEWAERQTRA